MEEGEGRGERERDNQVNLKEALKQAKEDKILPLHEKKWATKKGTDKTRQPHACRPCPHQKKKKKPYTTQTHISFADQRRC
jgi:hypothetical protein